MAASVLSPRRALAENGAVVTTGSIKGPRGPSGPPTLSALGESCQVEGAVGFPDLSRAGKDTVGRVSAANRVIPFAPHARDFKAAAGKVWAPGQACRMRRLGGSVEKRVLSLPANVRVVCGIATARCHAPRADAFCVYPRARRTLKSHVGFLHRRFGAVPQCGVAKVLRHSSAGVQWYAGAVARRTAVRLCSRFCHCF